MAQFHPLFQGLMILVVVAAWSLGMMRMRKPKADDPLRFRRKLHMKVGKVATIGILIGAVGGYAGALSVVGKIFNFSDTHALTALPAIFFTAMGLYTGLLLEKNPGQNPNLTKVHGMVNSMALAFCLIQMRTGLDLLQNAAK